MGDTRDESASGIGEGAAPVAQGDGDPGANGAAEQTAAGAGDTEQPAAGDQQVQE